MCELDSPRLAEFLERLIARLTVVNSAAKAGSPLTFQSCRVRSTEWTLQPICRLSGVRAVPGILPNRHGYSWQVASVELD